MKSRLSDADVARLVSGRHADPHALLGAHAADLDGRPGAVVRAFHPEAVRAECVVEGGKDVALAQVDPRGLFEGPLPDRSLPFPYRIRFHFEGGGVWERGDPYRFLPTLGELDLHLLSEGTHRRLWEALGATRHRADGVEGVRFAVWAPNAVGVSVVGDFCGWDGRLLPMRSLGASGVWEIFVPELEIGAIYKYEIRASGGGVRLKSDPMARAADPPPMNASRVADSTYRWSDTEWMRRRASGDPTREPVSIYEVHLGSWARVPEEGNRWLGYREIAPRLAAHVKELGFTHVELLPIAEHPFDGSWGYQVTGYFAPTSRYGSPDDFRYFVDVLHRHGIGVVLDWVPAHFPRDDFALRLFDGTALYEHENPRRAEHPDWGTLIFNYGRREVRNFLIANALYWLEVFHIDGLRVDAVASMLYLDYSREEGDWDPNPYGGRDNLEAIDFLRELNATIHAEQPGCFTAAEESTAWPGVTRDVSEGGLGFTFKWNMGWMHDTLAYFSREPAHRRWHQDDLTFAMLYEHSERFLMPLSHDEVVHGKGSLLSRMPGDEWQRFANLRALLAYQWTRPGKKLLFMDAELAPWDEWSLQKSLDWHLAGDPLRAGLARFLSDLGALYRAESSFWRRDPDPESFQWIDCQDRENSVISFLRRDGERHAVVILNMTPVPRPGYRIGVPAPDRYARRLDTDDPAYGGSGWSETGAFDAEPVPWHGFPCSVQADLPPLAVTVLVPEPT
ncbi:MAG: 1,4-alpha-glucan branching protein GlgB [Myxococcales bacterium]|nr:1,4-alpha-glucan branching protein GlgB [Myxococcales bacterium]